MHNIVSNYSQLAESTTSLQHENCLALANDSSFFLDIIFFLVPIILSILLSFCIVGCVIFCFHSQIIDSTLHRYLTFYTNTKPKVRVGPPLYPVLIIQWGKMLDFVRKKKELDGQTIFQNIFPIYYIHNRIYNMHHYK